MVMVVLVVTDDAYEKGPSNKRCVAKNLNSQKIPSSDACGCSRSQLCSAETEREEKMGSSWK
jgi:hypothetical protein